MGALLIFCPASYLLGSIPFGVLFSRLLRDRDPRSSGSGNIGATNVFRSVGQGLGILTLFCDAAKGWLPVWLATQSSLPAWGIALVGLCCFLGHIFPVYLRFQGGKGVATGAGIFLALQPYALLGSSVVFILGLILSGYVSVGSMLSAIMLPCLILALSGIHPYLGLATICSVLVLWKHRENLRRLMEGKERSWRR
jgi:glycerol-3-phosphate acyltransferase PlsY